MVGKEAAGAVTKALPASLLGDVVAARPLHGSEGARKWLRDKHGPAMQLNSWQGGGMQSEAKRYGTYTGEVPC